MIGKYNPELTMTPAGISSGPTMAGLASAKAHQRAFGFTADQFGNVDGMEETQLGSEADTTPHMLNRPSLMNSDILFNTCSELPRRSEYDSKLFGEMSTMR